MRGWWSVVAAVALGACSDDEGDGVPDACQDITDACHEADAMGVEGAAECHDIAHADEQATCEAERDACIALCEAGLE